MGTINQLPEHIREDVSPNQVQIGGCQYEITQVCGEPSEHSILELDIGDCSSASSVESVFVNDLFEESEGYLYIPLGDSTYEEIPLPNRCDLSKRQQLEDRDFFSRKWPTTVRDQVLGGYIGSGMDGETVLNEEARMHILRNGGAYDAVMKEDVAFDTLWRSLQEQRAGQAYTFSNDLILATLDEKLELEVGGAWKFTEPYNGELASRLAELYFRVSTDLSHELSSGRMQDHLSRSTSMYLRYHPDKIEEVHTRLMPLAQDSEAFLKMRLKAIKILRDRLDDTSAASVLDVTLSILADHTIEEARWPVFEFAIVQYGNELILPLAQEVLNHPGSHGFDRTRAAEYLMTHDPERAVEYYQRFYDAFINEDDIISDAPQTALYFLLTMADEIRGPINLIGIDTQIMRTPYASSFEDYHTGLLGERLRAHKDKDQIASDADIVRVLDRLIDKPYGLRTATERNIIELKRLILRVSFPDEDIQEAFGRDHFRLFMSLSQVNQSPFYFAELFLNHSDMSLDENIERFAFMLEASEWDLDQVQRLLEGFHGNDQERLTLYRVAYDHFGHWNSGSLGDKITELEALVAAQATSDVEIDTSSRLKIMIR